jgi:hypothetical protein
MARAPRRRLIAAAVLALTGLVAACSGGEDPAEPAAPEPAPATSAPSASPSPSPSAEGDDKPERPAAMEQHDAEGAAAAAEYFIALYPYIMKTGDTAEFKAMSHEACGYCTATLENEQWLRDNQAEFSGGELRTALEESYQRDAATGLYPFDVRVTQEAIRITNSEGAEVDSVEPTTSIARVEVGLRENQWVITTVTHKPVD